MYYHYHYSTATTTTTAKTNSGVWGGGDIKPARHAGGPPRPGTTNTTNTTTTASAGVPLILTLTPTAMNSLLGGSPSPILNLLLRPSSQPRSRQPQQQQQQPPPPPPPQQLAQANSGQMYDDRVTTKVDEADKGEEGKKKKEKEGDLALVPGTLPSPPLDPGAGAPVDVPQHEPSNHKEKDNKEEEEEDDDEEGKGTGTYCSPHGTKSSPPPPTPQHLPSPLLPILPPEVTLEMVEMISSLLAFPSDAALAVATAHAIIHTTTIGGESVLGGVEGSLGESGSGSGGLSLVAATELGRVGACEAIVGALLASAHDITTAHSAIVALGTLALCPENNTLLGMLGACDAIAAAVGHMHTAETAATTTAVVSAAPTINRDSNGDGDGGCLPATTTPADFPLHVMRALYILAGDPPSCDPPISPLTPPIDPLHVIWAL